MLTPSTPDRISIASIRPDRTPPGRSIWPGSPVTTIRLPSPRRVNAIFICMVVVFCASSRMTKLCASVRPRMKANGAISDFAGLDAFFHLFRRQKLV